MAKPGGNPSHQARHLRSYNRRAERMDRAARRDDAQRFAPGYRDALALRCMATTVMDPEAHDWSPDQPDTVVTATCDLGQYHKGWHVSPDGYSWHPEDDTQHVQFPTPERETTA